MLYFKKDLYSFFSELQTPVTQGPKEVNVDLYAKDLGIFELFAGLTADELHTLASILSCKTFQEDEILIEVDTMGEEIYFIRTGLVGIEIDMVGNAGSERIAKLGEGSSVGEFILTRKARRSAMATALTPVETYMTTYEKMMNLFEAQPRIGLLVFKNLSAVLVERLKNTNMSLRNAVSSGYSGS